MKRAELVKMLKPLIIECVHEVIFKDGLLSGIITEVTKGLNGGGVQMMPQTQMMQPQMVPMQPQQPQMTPQQQQMMEIRRVQQQQMSEMSIADKYGVQPVSKMGEMQSGAPPSDGQRLASVTRVDPSIQKILAEASAGAGDAPGVDMAKEEMLSKPGLGVDLINSLMSGDKNFIRRQLQGE